jgi:hypothetical protein
MPPRESPRWRPSWHAVSVVPDKVMFSKFFSRSTVGIVHSLAFAGKRINVHECPNK